VAKKVSKRDQDEKEEKEKKDRRSGWDEKKFRSSSATFCDRPSDKGVTALYFGSTELIFMNQRAKTLRESERNMTMRKDDGQVTIEINAVRGPCRK